MNTRIHISLPVHDLPKAIAFYERLFNQPVTKRKPGYANFRLDQPPIHLALEAGASTKPTAVANHSHFGLELSDSTTFAAWRARLKDAGAQARDEQDAVCCYAKADKLWLTDPDGNAWEVWVRKADAEVMRGEGQTCCAA